MTDPTELVPLIETLFDTIPVIVCVVVRTSVRVPVAVTEDDAVTVKLDIFELIPLLVILTVADEVLETVELRVIVRVPRGLFDVSELFDTVAVIVLVFEPSDRVKVADALGVLEAREADTVVVVVEVFEEDADLVYGVFEAWPVTLGALGLGAELTVTETENIAVEVAALSDRCADKLIEFLGLRLELRHEEDEDVGV